MLRKIGRLAVVLIITVSVASVSVLPLGNDQPKATPPIKPIQVIAIVPTIEDIKPIRTKLPKMEQQPSRSAKSNVHIRTFMVTAYTGTDSGEVGNSITASGKKATAYKTIAAPSDIPFGTVLIDTKTGIHYLVEDRGGAIKGSHLDLYVGHSNVREAKKFGVQYKTFEVVLPK